MVAPSFLSTYRIRAVLPGILLLGLMFALFPGEATAQEDRVRRQSERVESEEERREREEQERRQREAEQRQQQPPQQQQPGQIEGRVIDDVNGEPLIGAVVFTADKKAGANTDAEGRFRMRYNGQLPVTVICTYIGYDTLKKEVTSFDDPIVFRMKEGGAFEVETIDVVGKMISERQQEDPRTVETMDITAIEETPAVNFYDGLASLKGVDITSASMGFKVINTRGFNSTTPVRSLTLIDGYDNQSPGLNFSLGNFVGVSDLDVQRVEIIQGAGSVTYGPGAFNGVISMETKSPFVHEGLAVQMKVGEREMWDGALRYAHVFRNKAGEDKFAIKINASYMRAYDWEADNLDPTDQSLRGRDNPGGYDAINRYGDENLRPARNNFSSPGQVKDFPGLDIYYRTGYMEEDLVDYNTTSLKLNSGLYYKLTDSITAGYNYNFSTGTTVYQGDNRYSLKDLEFYQHRLELRHPDWFILAYMTGEDAGKSYDAVFTGLLLQERAKDNTTWDRDYTNNYINNLNELTGLNGYSGDNAELAEAFLAANPDIVASLHRRAREFADSPGRDFFGNPTGEARLEPGTPEFQQAFNEITSNPSFTEGGARFVDESALYHIKGQYTFRPSFMDITVGGRYRMYTPQSFGTVFSDTLIYNEDSTSSSRRNIDIYEAGGYLLLEKDFLRRRILLSAGTRVDKSQNFDVVVSPAASAVFKIQQRHNIRLNATTSLRNPTLADQYLFYNVGRARLIGNVDGFDNVVTIEDYFNIAEQATTTFNDTLRAISFNIDPIKPERVQTIEIGYKGNPTNPLFIDASAYYSWYQDFIGFNFVTPAPPDSIGDDLFIPDPYRVSANAEEQVTTVGAMIGINYFFGNFYSIGGNYTFTELAADADDPIIPAYNTPRHKFNITIGARDIVYDIGGAKGEGDETASEPWLRIRNVGFNATFRWVDGFFFEGSPQFTGFVEEYWTVDAQVNYTVPKWNATFKLGASNLLDREYIQVYGGPTIGRLAYFQVNIDVK